MKIAFFINEYRNYFDLLKNAAQEEDVDLIFCLYDDLLMSFVNNELEVKINEYNLKDFDLVYFRNINAQTEIHITLSEYCRQQKIAVLDRALLYNSPWIVSKNFTYTRLLQFGIPIIDSEFVSVKNYASVLQRITFPCIAKITHGAAGDGVHLCHSKQEIEVLFAKYEEHLILQRFIENDGDIRAFVIGNKVIGAMERKRVGKDEYRNNVSLGGEAIAYDIPQELASLAVGATQALQYTISGVDLIFDRETQSWRVIEVNKAPQYLGIMKAISLNVPKLIVQHLKTEAGDSFHMR